MTFSKVDKYFRRAYFSNVETKHCWPMWHISTARGCSRQACRIWGL